MSQFYLTSLTEMKISSHVYSDLINVISFLDPGPHGTGRFSMEMLPEIEQRDFRKGAQVHV